MVPGAAACFVTKLLCWTMAGADESVSCLGVSHCCWESFQRGRQLGVPRWKGWGQHALRCLRSAVLWKYGHLACPLLSRPLSPAWRHFSSSSFDDAVMI